MVSAFVFGKRQLMKTISQQNFDPIKRYDSVYFNWCNGNRNFAKDSLVEGQVDYSKVSMLSDKELQIFMDNLPQSTIYTDSSFTNPAHSPKGDAYVNVCIQREYGIFANVSIMMKLSENGKYPFFYAKRSLLVWVFFGWVTIESGSIAGP